MPISRENAKRYPSNWKEIRRQIMARAKNRCECIGECGLHPHWRCQEIHGRKGRFAPVGVGHGLRLQTNDILNGGAGGLRAEISRGRGMTPKHAGPSDADWNNFLRQQTEAKMRKSVTIAAVEWVTGARSEHSLRRRVQYWLRRLARR